MAWAVPLFLGLMGIEYLVARKTGKNYFGFSSSVSNINIGIAERLLDTFTVGIFYFVYDYLQHHFGLFNIRSSVLLWIALLILTDFIWYWYHRLAHEVNVLWAAHVVHHQSEDFNYTVSARITVFQAFFRMCFWSILPVIGFPAAMIISVQLVHGIYPFFIHTRTIGKLGILEYIFVTPSHHRVHHASNDKYLDKNYGDVFIIWDKLFGTFAQEEEEPEYGLTKPLDSHSFLWQHFHFILEIYYTLKQSKGFRARWNVVFGKPDHIDPEIRPKLEERFLFRNTTVGTSKKLQQYVVGQMGAILLLLFLFLLFENYVPVFAQLCITLVILLTLVNVGAIMEQRRWVFYLEYARLVITFTALFYMWPHPLLLLVFAIVQLPFYLYRSSIEKRYLQLVYGGKR
ncbi:sterol desaturase family protein [Chitinophaga filiformis]|uniref:Sterol desaturase/sphingolipid hydroxylase, fatty acid hydroxylase superfamily n=1 Tax=Chitinophaga filiformis TaxID=104663 RepID=A0A1G7UFZ5_CHIFI|nr:sterol desaturase family protein [Chitinophaga filiformis]SDG45690.1 Sterol desaturase/sphingolipid hydroxylase, fatty acid hydroxylase superfamily [Chitinophaga filiformis]